MTLNLPRERLSARTALKWSTGPGIPGGEILKKSPWLTTLGGRLERSVETVECPWTGQQMELSFCIGQGAPSAFLSSTLLLGKGVSSFSTPSMTCIEVRFLLMAAGSLSTFP